MKLRDNKSETSRQNSPPDSRFAFHASRITPHASRFMCASHAHAVRRRSASVLVGLLWCVALLSVVVIGVLHTARLDSSITKSYGDRIQAHYLALAGVERAKALLYQDLLDRKRAGKNHTGNLYDAPEQFRDIELGPGKF